MYTYKPVLCKQYKGGWKNNGEFNNPKSYEIQVNTK